MRIEFQKFKKVYKRINKNDRHNIFYHSLFDASSFEINGQKDKQEFYEIRKGIREMAPKLGRMIKKIDGKLGKKILAKRDEFLKSFVYPDVLCKYIVSCELAERKIECKISKKIGDLLVKGKNTIIEIKRLISGAQLQSIFDDLVPKFKKEEYKNFNLILVLLFPQIGIENLWRISQLIEIYYFVEAYLKEKFQEDRKEVKVIIQYITRENIKKYNLESVVHRLTSIINKI